MRFATRHYAVLFCVSLAAALPAGSAKAQIQSREAISRQDQILEMRHEMQQRGNGNGTDNGEALAPPISAEQAPQPQAGYGSTPQAGYGSTPQAGSGLTPQLLNRVATLEEEVRSLRGQVDQLNNQVQQQGAALNKQIGDLSFKVQQGHADGASTAAPATAPRPKPTGRVMPDDLVRHGESALGRRDYRAAEADARQALASASGTHGTDARYLLAQSLAGQRHYQQAATAYYDVYSNAPRSSRAPEALLGVSTSLLALHDKTDACEALRKLAATYAHPAAHVRSAATTLRGRAGCQ